MAKRKQGEDITTRIAQRILAKVRVIRDGLPVIGKDSKLKAKKKAKTSLKAKTKAKVKAAPKKKVAASKKISKKARSKSVRSKKK